MVKGMGLRSLECAALLVLALVSVAAAQPGSNSYERSVLAIQEQIQSGNLDKAHALALKAEQAYPSNGGLENLQGVIAIQHGDFEEAEKEFSAAIRHSPRLTSAYLNLGRIFIENAAHDPDAKSKALHIYERALAITPENAEANYYAALLLLREGKFGLSLQHLASLGPDEKQRIGALVIACADEAGIGHVIGAERNAAALAAMADLAETDVVETMPALLAARRADLADRLLSAVASHQALSAAGLRILGLAQEAEGKLPVAQETLERAFASDSASKTILVDLARVAEARNDYTGALGYLAHARDIDPKDANLPYRFGAICLKLSLLSESRKALSEAVRMEPENADYNYALGTVTIFAQNPSEALPYLTKFHALRPRDKAGILALGTTYFRAKDFESALPWLNQAAGNPGTAATALYYLGRIDRQEGRQDEALAKLTRAAALDPSQPDLFAELGQLYLQMKRFTEAEKQLNRAAALDSENYAANFGLLQLYARTGDPRREEQSKSFESIKQKNEEQLREAMRVLEIHPLSDPAK